MTAKIIPLPWVKPRDPDDLVPADWMVNRELWRAGSADGLVPAVPASHPNIPIWPYPEQEDGE